MRNLKSILLYCTQHSAVTSTYLSWDTYELIDCDRFEWMTAIFSENVAGFF